MTAFCSGVASRKFGIVVRLNPDPTYLKIRRLFWGRRRSSPIWDSSRQEAAEGRWLGWASRSRSSLRSSRGRRTRRKTPSRCWRMFTCASLVINNHLWLWYVNIVRVRECLLSKYDDMMKWIGYGMMVTLRKKDNYCVKYLDTPTLAYFNMVNRISSSFLYFLCCFFLLNVTIYNPT